jgi:hypothetical protein
VAIAAPDSRRGAALARTSPRIRGRPAVVRYELHDLRSGTRRVFVRVDRLVAFLRQRGLEVAVPEPDPEREG